MPTAKGREDRGASVSPSRGTPISSTILDAAFRRAHRATPHGDTRLDRSRRRAQLKIIRSGAVTLRHLRLAAKPFQSAAITELDRLLVARAFGERVLDRSLARLRHAETRIRGVSTEEQRRLRQLDRTEDFADSVRRFYGRLASFVREVEPDLVRLREIAGYLKDRPRLREDEPTVVVAGFPNVGKSSLVARLSSARPKVAAHPFTTLALQVGHADLGFDRMQVLDTPGVLGRARKANPAEIEAQTAVERAATVVVFVLDPTEQCGYPITDQEALLERWRTEFPSLPFLVVQTKADLRRLVVAGRLSVSAVSGEGLDELRAQIQRALERWKPPETATATGEDPDPGEDPALAPHGAM